MSLKGHMGSILFIIYFVMEPEFDEEVRTWEPPEP
jgi:hypothetical protein